MALVTFNTRICIYGPHQSSNLSHFSHRNGSHINTASSSSYFSSSSAVTKLVCVCAKRRIAESDEKLSFPPSSREEAINQVSRSLNAILQKNLKNAPSSWNQQVPKKLQLRLRVEIPVIDDSPFAVSSLLGGILDELSLKRKGHNVEYAIFWADDGARDLGDEILCKIGRVKNWDMASAMELLQEEYGEEDLGKCDVLVFVAPSIDQMRLVESIWKRLRPRPTVLVNPTWSVEDEGEDDGFVSGFEVVYSFTPLAIQGFFSKTEGAVFRHVVDAYTDTSAPWLLLKKQDGGQYKVVLRFTRRPTSVELESALYDTVARDSPITKSVKFLKGLVSGSKGKK